MRRQNRKDCQIFGFDAVLCFTSCKVVKNLSDLKVKGLFLGVENTHYLCSGKCEE